MAKTIIEAPRGETTFLVAPEEARIIGVDTPHERGQHPLWQKRAFRPPNEASVLNMMVNGNKFVPPIQLELAEDGGWDLADGRGRVIDAREANRRLRERGAEPFALKALVKRQEDVATSFERMIVPNSFATLPTLMDRLRDACAALERGVSEERVALIAGVGVPQIRQWKMVHDAPDVMARVESGEISMTTGVQIAKKPAPLQKRALENALRGGRRATRREVDAASGKVLPPTRKQLRAFIADVEKRRDELAQKGHSALALSATLDALRFAYAGGELPAALQAAAADTAKRPSKRAAQPATDSLVAAARKGIEDAILEFGLTETATAVSSFEEKKKSSSRVEHVETIATRLEAAGWHIDGKDLSQACRALHAAGRIDRGPGGYRLKRASEGGAS